MHSTSAQHLTGSDQTVRRAASLPDFPSHQRPSGYRHTHRDENRVAMETPNTDNLSALEQLPAELLLKVLCFTPDLSSLHSLLLASARVSRAFPQAARHVTDAVISASLPPLTQAAARAVVRIRVSAHECRCVDDVRALHHEQTPPPLPSAAAPALLRRFVALAHQIHCLTHACLESYLERCTTSLRPILPPDRRFPRALNGGPVLPPREDGTPYEIPAQEPPSWIEEHRVLRSMWLVQAVYELQRARLDGRLVWTKAEMASLERLSAVDFRGLRCYGCESEQLLTVVDFLGQLSGERTGSTPIAFRMPQPPCAGQGSFHYICALELQFGFRQDKWDQGRDRLHSNPLGFGFNRSIASGPRSPLQCISFEPYRRYGFAIWDNKRLTSLGFFHGDKARAWLQPDDLYFIWRSILTDEEVEEARRLSLAMFP